MPYFLASRVINNFGKYVFLKLFSNRKVLFYYHDIFDKSGFDLDLESLHIIIQDEEGEIICVPTNYQTQIEY